METKRGKYVVAADGRISNGKKIIHDDEVKIVRIDNHHIVGISGDSIAAQMIATTKEKIASIVTRNVRISEKEKLSRLYYEIKKSTKKYSGDCDEIEVLLASARGIYSCYNGGTIMQHKGCGAIGSGADVANQIYNRDKYTGNIKNQTIQSTKDYLFSIINFVQQHDSTVGPAKAWRSL